MLILSFDIGIKNLAYCICKYDIDNKDVSIQEWGIINLLDDIFDKQEKCMYFGRKRCNKVAEFKNNNGKFYCKTHKKNHDKDNTKTLSSLIFKTKKQLTEYNKKHKLKKFKVEKCKDYPIDKLCDIIIQKFDKDYPHFLQVDYVLLELQPVLKAPRMKTISNYIYMYFRMNGIHYKKGDYVMKNVSYIMATNKLKFNENNCKSDIEDYSSRKFTGIENVVEYLKIIKDNDNLILFQSHKKKDDLADALLQILFFLQRNYNYK